MSTRSLYPSIRPSLNLDFANTRVLDPRVTFARASTATYYDGKTTHKAEENLVTNSVNLGSPSQIVNNTLTNNSTGTTAPDGTQTSSLLVPDTVNTRHYASSPPGSTAVLNTPYTFSCFVKAAGYNFAHLQLSSGTAGGGSRYGTTVDLTNGTVTGYSASVNVTNTSTTVTSFGNGWYRVALTASFTVSNPSPIIVLYVHSMPTSSATTGADSLPSYAGNGTSGCYFWGFQLEQRSAATVYTATTSSAITRYQPTLLTASDNTPRFDHNPITGESLGLLIEEQRTNLITYSENFGNSFWTKNDCFLTQNGVAPDGTNNATLVTRNSTAYNYVFVIRYSQSVTTGQTYTFSVFLKPGTYSGGIQLSLDSSGTGGYPIAGAIVTNLSNGTYASGSASSYTITQYGNGWYRVSVTGTATADGSIEYSVNTNEISIGQNFYIWGAQLELGYFPTSYIPTSGAQATRSADAASITGTNFSSWFDQEKGSLYLETQALSSTSAINRRLLFLSSLDDTYAVELNFGAGTNSIVASRRGLGANVLSMINNPAKVAFAWDMLGSSLSIDAQAVNSTSGSSTPRNFSALQFGKVEYPLPDGTAGNIYMKKIAYYSKKLTNSQLQALTTP